MDGRVGSSKSVRGSTLAFLEKLQGVTKLEIKSCKGGPSLKLKA